MYIVIFVVFVALLSAFGLHLKAKKEKEEAELIKRNQAKLDQIKQIQNSIISRSEKYTAIGCEISDPDARQSVLEIFDDEKILQDLLDKYSPNNKQEKLAELESAMKMVVTIIDKYVEIIDAPKNFANSNKKLEEAKGAIIRFDKKLSSDIQELNEANIIDFKVKVNMINDFKIQEETDENFIDTNTNNQDRKEETMTINYNEDKTINIVDPEGSKEQCTDAVHFHNWDIYKFGGEYGAIRVFKDSIYVGKDNNKKELRSIANFLGLTKLATETTADHTTRQIGRTLIDEIKKRSG
jgi:hypothetical protein